MGKKLILVGNKPPTRSTLANEIDSFDYVMRTGRMNYLEQTGNRIDGLFLEANYEFKNVYKGGENVPFFKIAGQILMRSMWHSCFTNWNEYLTEEQFNNIEIINEDFAIHETGFERLTSSIMLLGYLLNSHWNEKYDIYITCLDVENRAKLIDNNPKWNWHKGAGLYEQKFLIQKLKSKQIYRLKDE